MEKILEQLYTGEIYPFSKFQATIEDFKLNRDKAYQSYSVFLNKLPDELKEEFEKLIDDHLDLLPLEMKQNFINGFCMGTRMMSEVFYAPTSECEE